MQLNLPEYNFRISKQEGKQLIFDEIRRRWVKLTPEEWVRQHVIRYLKEEKSYPGTLMAVEHALRINRKDFRADIVVHSVTGKPLLVVECKAPAVKITQKAFDQIVRYNFQFQVDYLIVTNGLTHFCCRIDKAAQTYLFLSEIPNYAHINPLPV